MKSLLVDALRKAQDESAETPPDEFEVPTDGKPEVQPEDQLTVESTESSDNAISTESSTASSAGCDDLSLFETQAVITDEEIVAQNDNLIVDALDPQPPTVQQSSHSSEKIRRQTPQQSNDVAPIPGIVPLIEDESETSTTDVGKCRGRRSVTRWVASATPMLCIVALVGAAAGKLLVDKQSSGSINGSMLQVSAPGLSDTSTMGPDAGNSRFSGSNSKFLERSVTADGVITESSVQLVPASVVSAESTVADSADGSKKDSIVESISDFVNDGAELVQSTAGSAAPNDDAFEWVVAGYRFYRAGDFDSAELNFLDALSVEPNHKDALAGLAAVYQKTDRFDLALIEYDKLLTADPGNTLARSALLAIRSGQLRDGNESELKLLLQRFPDAHHLHHALGQLYVSEQKWADARQAFSSAYEIAPAVADYSYNLAVSLERLGQTEGARHYYEVAIAAAGEEPNFDLAAVRTHLATLRDQYGESS